MARAIEFVLRSRAGAIRKGVIIGTEADPTVDLSAGGDLSLRLTPADLEAVEPAGEDLRLLLGDGRLLTVTGLLADLSPASRLFVSHEGVIAQVTLQEGPDGRLELGFGGADHWGRWRPNEALIFPPGLPEPEDSDVPAPPAEAAVAQPPSIRLEGGSLRPEAETGLTHLTLRGRATPGTLIAVTLDGLEAGLSPAEGETSQDGRWEVEFPALPLPPGASGQPLSMSATDASGRVAHGRDAVLLEAATGGCTRIGIGDLSSEGALSAIEDREGVTLSGRAVAGAIITLVLNLEGGERLEAETAADSRGIWAARLGHDQLPAGAYGATLLATAVAPGGDVACASQEFRIDNSSSPADPSEPAAEEDEPEPAALDIAELDLTQTPESTLVLTEERLRDLTRGGDTLVVHGDAQGSVTAIGAEPTGDRMQIDGTTYHVYRLGEAGASLIVNEDILLHIAAA